MKPLLYGLALFAAYEAYTVLTTGYDVFYKQPVDPAYRGPAALKWGAGAAASVLLATGMRS